MTITRSVRASAEQVAATGLAEGLNQQNLRAIAYALGCPDADAVLAHLNPRTLKTRIADLLVESVIEAMEDAQVAA